MEKLLHFYSKYKKRIIIISALLLVILFLMPFITTRRMDIDSHYFDKEDVALYLMQYHELPSNFITKYGYDYAGKGGLVKSYNVIGGDTHINKGQLRDFNVDTSANLKECDIVDKNYQIESIRGKQRLVYTCNTNNVRVFYTNDHYANFVEITNFSLQLTRNIFWIIFAIYVLITAIFYITIIVYTKKKKQINS